MELLYVFVPVAELVLDVDELEDEPVDPPRGGPHVAPISPVLLKVSASFLPPVPLVMSNLVFVY